MKKNISSVKIGENGYVVNSFKVYKFQNLEGKLLTIINSIGLQEKQEKAVCDLIRREVWDLWSNPEYTDVITSDSEDHSDI